MKKKFPFMLAIICAFLCSGCNNHNSMSEDLVTDSLITMDCITEENHISLSKVKEEKEYILNTLEMEHGQIGDIIGIKDDSIIYFSYENEDTIAAFYKYDINAQLTYRLGEVENPYIDSGDIAVIGDKIFLYRNQVIANSGYSDGTLKNSLYEIDSKNNTLTKIIDDFSYQTLIYLDAAENRIISMKGKVNGSKGISYLDTIDVFDKNGAGFDILLSKEYDRKDELGECIYQFAEYNSTLYVLLLQENVSNEPSWIVEKYDMNGNYLGCLNLDPEIVKLIKGERISKFFIFGKYGFIKNFSSGAALFSIHKDKIVPELWRELSLDIAAPASGDDFSNVILYSRDTGEIWKFDIAAYELNKLDLSYEHINYIYIDDNNKFLLSSDETIYGEIDKIPIEQQILLSNRNIE